ncbi:glutathione S-transferase family protein [Acinetobacter stercoris]|uniref:Stringent starvation protein A n=1 Tax=Acinetobacter stercoris TaxID=2126983 RepID=A0A2U3MU87_9GAMM|nr:glutathione S-transferase family protein [Acinetobacter stercoris]SPL68935.1 Stringent starvation protein A [Acinetobacter stercoris]
MLELFIGNKNYSTWSMRPWLVLKAFDIPFQEHFIAFDDFHLDRPFKQSILKINPTGKVPAVVNGDLVVWDSLAICEYLAELYPDKTLWPSDLQLRAQARSISAEMHSGFQMLRQLCPMNIEADLSTVGIKLWDEHQGLRDDVARIEQIWAKRPSGESFLFGDFSIADAFYIPVVMRFISFQLPVSASGQAYMETVLKLESVQQWIEQAKQEHQFVPVDEPYRKAP